MNETPAWLSTITNLADTAGNLYGSIKGTNATTKVQTQAAAAKTSMMPFVLIGAAVLAVVAFLAFRKN